MFFRTKKQIYDFVTNEMHRIENKMRILDPASDEYATLQRRYSELINLKKSNRNAQIMYILFKTLEIGISAAGTVMVPMALARISYISDQNMDLCNSRIWNLIGRNTKTKF